MKISTWNVNSINARLPILLNWLKSSNPDIVLLQELKCTKENFPSESIQDLGYNIVLHGQKTYNGVAILSKYPIDEYHTILPNAPQPDQARYIEAVVSLENKALRVGSVYVPNGGEIGSDKFEYKLEFFDRLNLHLANLLKFEEITIIGGDFNVAPDKIDVYDAEKLENTTCFSPVERQKFLSLIRLGYYDAFRLANKDRQEFSWWDYRAGAWQKNHGMRIDHLLLSPEAVDLLLTCEIEESLRKLEKPSDHVPVTINLT